MHLRQGSSASAELRGLHRPRGRDAWRTRPREHAVPSRGGAIPVSDTGTRRHHTGGGRAAQRPHSWLKGRANAMPTFQEPRKRELPRWGRAARTRCHSPTAIYGRAKRVANLLTCENNLSITRCSRVSCSRAPTRTDPSASGPWLSQTRVRITQPALTAAEV